MSEQEGNEGRTVRTTVTPVILSSGVNARPAPEQAEENIDAPLAQRVAKSRLNEIAKKIEDPNFSQVDIMKLIASEITEILISQNAILDYVSRRDTAAINKVSTKEVIVSLNEQLKGVELLGRQITNMDNLAKRDYINFDGDKFRWVAGQWADLGAAALRRIGLNESQVHSWYQHYRDEVKANQERIRRDAERQVWLDEAKEKEKAHNAAK